MGRHSSDPGSGGCEEEELSTHFSDTSDTTDNVPDDDLQVNSVPDVLESKGLHLQVVVTNATKAVLTSDDSPLYSSHPPDPGSLLCLPALTETRPGPRRKGRIKLVTGCSTYSIIILLFVSSDPIKDRYKKINSLTPLSPYKYLKNCRFGVFSAVLAFFSHFDFG